jgi:atypical dual specificity phosphatase
VRALLLLLPIALAGCFPVGTLSPTSQEEKVTVSTDIHNFSWLVPDLLAGMAKPGAYQDLDDDLAALDALGVRLVITLTEDALPAADLANHGLDALHVPVEDYTAPTQKQMVRFVREARESMDAKRPVAAHCYAGKGRTGTMLAAYLVSDGRKGQQAIDEIRELRPGSIETEEQEQAVIDFEQTWAELFPVD